MVFLARVFIVIAKSKVKLDEKAVRRAVYTRSVSRTFLKSEMALGKQLN